MPLPPQRTTTVASFSSTLPLTDVHLKANVCVPTPSTFVSMSREPSLEDAILREAFVCVTPHEAPRVPTLAHDTTIGFPTVTSFGFAIISPIIVYSTLGVDAVGFRN